MKCKRTCINCKHCRYIPFHIDRNEHYRCTKDPENRFLKIEDLWGRCKDYEIRPDIDNMEVHDVLYSITGKTKHGFKVKHVGDGYSDCPASVFKERVMEGKRAMKDFVNVIEITGYTTLIKKKNGKWKDIGCSPVVVLDENGKAQQADRSQYVWEGVIFTDNRKH